MADVRKYTSGFKKDGTNKILQWYDTMHRFQQTQTLDQAINIAIAGLLIVTTFTFAAQFLVQRPTVVYNAHANCTVAKPVNETHAINRMLNRVTGVLKDSCDEHNDVNIATLVFINNMSSELDVFYMCDTNEMYENARILKVGAHAGKCSETYANITKTKTRSFPIVVKNTKTGKKKTYYTLKESCAIHSALERLRCTW